MKRRTRADLVFLLGILLLANWLGMSSRTDVASSGCGQQHREWFHDENTCEHDCCQKATGRYGE